MSETARDLHLRIGRITVDAAPGTDRRALMRELQQQLPGAIAARLGSNPVSDLQATTVSGVADAVAARVRQEVPR
jgi:hypothetical protein